MILIRGGGKNSPEGAEVVGELQSRDGEGLDKESPAGIQARQCAGAQKLEGKKGSRAVLEGMLGRATISFKEP